MSRQKVRTKSPPKKSNIKKASSNSSSKKTQKNVNPKYDDAFVGLIGGGFIGGIAAGPGGALLGSAVGAFILDYLNHENK